MKPYSIELLCDDDFGVPSSSSWYAPITTNKVEGIKSISGNTAYVDENVFVGKNFWVPVSKFINTYDNYEELSLDELGVFLSQFGVFTLDCNTFNFDLDNDYDLSSVNYDNDRVGFYYKNSPMNSVYLIDLGDSIRILPSVFSKRYYTICDYEWIEFLRADIDVVELREIKINSILDNKTPYSNIIRQMMFHCEYGDNKDFVSKILKYYRRGFILSEKQINSVKLVLY